MVVFIHAYNYFEKGAMNMEGTDIAIELPAQMIFIMDLFSRKISEIANYGFFFLAGLFLFRKDFSFANNIKKKIKTLVIPAIIVTTFWIVIYIAGEAIPFTRHFFANPDRMILQWDLLHWLDAYFAISPGSYMLVYPLWFAKELFLLNILAYPMKLLMDRWPVIMIAVILAFCFWGSNIPVIGSVIPINISFFAGYYVVHYGIHLESIENIKMWMISLVYAMTLVVSYIELPGLAGNLIGKLSIAVSFVFWYKVATEIFNKASGRIKKAVLVIAKYSFLIYIMHELNLRLLQKIVFKLMPGNNVSYAIQYMACPVVIIALIVLFSILLEKKLPALYSLLSGGRK